MVSSAEIATIRDRHRHWLLGGRIEFASHPWVQKALTGSLENVERGRALARGLLARGPDSPPLRPGRGEGTYHGVSYDALYPLVWEWCRTGGDEERESALGLFRLLEENGFRAGSSSGRGFLGGLTVAAYAHAVFLFREPLREAGRLDAAVDTVLWYAEFEKAFGTPAFTETNADALRTSALNCLAALLALEEGAIQSGLLAIWQRWIEAALEIHPCFTGVFKPDGTGFHHNAHYTSAYVPHACSFAALLVYEVHATSLAFSDSAFAVLKRALMTHRFLNQKYDPPSATRGRLLMSCPVPEAYAYLGLAAGGADRELLGVCRDLLDGLEEAMPHEVEMDIDGSNGKFLFLHTPGRLELLLEAEASGVPPVRPGDGFRALPWGGLAIHRQGCWMAAVKAWSQYVWDFEMHPKQWAAFEENVYGRYASHGTLQILTRTGLQGSGWDLFAGWDWSHWPGSTTPHRRPEQLYDPAKSWACRFFSGATFAGAVSLADEAGVFAFRLRDHYFDPGLHALKSCFFAGDEILCLGSNIESLDPAFAVHTTLFQCRADKGALLINGEPVTSEDFHWEAPAGEPVTLVDPAGHAYFVPDGTGLHVRRAKQTSQSPGNGGSTEGLYATCWIDHGFLPADRGKDDAFYEYRIVPECPAGEVARRAGESCYEVLRRDHRAHIVSLDAAVTGGAIFETDWLIPEGPVARTDTPVLYLARAEADGCLELALSDPDLRLPKRRNMMFLDEEARFTPARPHTLELALHGRWKLTEVPDGVEVHRIERPGRQLTGLRVVCQSGLTRTLRLQPD